MPPRGMFRSSDRPSGLEFGSCEKCNVGTKAADSAIAFFSRLEQFNDNVADWKVKEARKFLRSVEQGAPGFSKELFGESENEALLRTKAGILIEVAEMHAGPIGQALLHVFAAKLGMALFHEHTGTPLPMTGGVHCQWFLNSGISEEVANTFFNILPVYGTLQQGRRHVSGQFDYRYNTDDKTIVAAFSHFHGNIHFFTIAVADPEPYGFPRSLPFSAFVRPGELLKFMPKRPPAILINPTADVGSGIILPFNHNGARRWKRF